MTDLLVRLQTALAERYAIERELGQVGCCHTVDTTWGFKWFDRNESAGISSRPGARDDRMHEHTRTIPDG